MSNKCYDTLRFIAELLLPALATLYAALAGIWGLPYAEAIVGTIAAIDTFLGAFVAYGKVKYDKKIKNATVNLVSCPYFTTNVINLDAESALKKDYSELDSFVILMSVSGSFILSYEGGSEMVKAGECILVPNVVNKVDIIANEECKLLEVYIV